MNSPSSSSPRKRPRRSTVQEGQDQIVTPSPHVSGSSSTCQPSSSGNLSGGDRQKLADLIDEGGGLVKDPNYYFSEADCVLRVEDTLFRVHRFLLARDSSAFQDMFDLSPQKPHGGQDKEQVEGISDRNPIILHGESAQNFRALLSVLYALPAEIHAYSTFEVDVPKLLSICSVANKYHFTSTEAWAISCLHSVLGEDGGCQQQHSPKYCSSAMLSAVLEVAVLCGHDLLQDLIEDEWVDRLWASTLDPLKALRAADAHGLSRLYGVACYILLLRLNEKLQYSHPIYETAANVDFDGLMGDTDEETTLPKPHLTPRERNCLLSGHLSLIHLWDRLRSTPPKFDRPDGCTYHQHGCLAYWDTTWDETSRSPLTLDVSKRPTADIVGKLESMKAQLDGSENLQCGLTPACRRRALESVKKLIEEVVGGLAGHFVATV